MKVQPVNRTALLVTWNQPETIYHPPIMNYMISYSWTKNEDEKEKTFTKDSDKDLVKPQHQSQTLYLAILTLLFSQWKELEEKSSCDLIDRVVLDWQWIAVKIFSSSWTLCNRLSETLGFGFIVCECIKDYICRHFFMCCCREAAALGNSQAVNTFWLLFSSQIFTWEVWSPKTLFLGSGFSLCIALCSLWSSFWQQVLPAVEVAWSRAKRLLWSGPVQTLPKSGSRRKREEQDSSITDGNTDLSPPLRIWFACHSCLSGSKYCTSLLTFSAYKIEVTYSGLKGLHLLLIKESL